MKTIWAARQAHDWNELTRAYVMLIDLHESMTGKTYDPAVDNSLPN